MFPHVKHKKAFTLTELLITVIIIGVISAFAIPNYTKTVNKARAKDAVYNLNLIREAVRLYAVREGSYPAAALNISTINTTFQTNVMEQEGNVYTCDDVNTYSCWATNAAGWQLSFRLNNNNGLVYCSIATCPAIQ
jgi:prepilin-type N-terminal cleavage/methylation domain-containing protein